MGDDNDNGLEALGVEGLEESLIFVGLDVSDLEEGVLLLVLGVLLLQVGGVVIAALRGRGVVVLVLLLLWVKNEEEVAAENEANLVENFWELLPLLLLLPLLGAILSSVVAVESPFLPKLANPR